ncbi:hypothetical protein HKK72_32695, partial [Actinomadura sp. HBU206391]
MPMFPPRMRLRPRSIRSRVTVMVTLLAVLLLVPAGVVGSMVARHAIAGSEWREVRRQADLTAADVRAGRPADSVVPTVAGADLIQVVAPGHR